MPIEQKEVGGRLRAAREAAALTQEQVAVRMGFSRATVAQIELGNRPVSSDELERLAGLYGRGLEEFLADDFAEDEAVAALFRAQGTASGAELQAAVGACLLLGRELSHLEQLLGLDRGAMVAPSYPAPTPRNRWEAVEQGGSLAQAERLRLGLGDAPVGSMTQILENQGVRTGMRRLGEDISGVTLQHPSAGTMVLVNEDEAPQRQRFSWTHEYAHVLVDRNRRGMVSRASERDNLLEVRANAFAATFLLPEPGVRAFLQRLGKGRPSRIHAELFDEATATAVDARTEAGSQRIQILEVVELAHHFGVSRIAALYRLRNLRLISEIEFAELAAADEKTGCQIARVLQLAEALPESRDELRRRLVMLASEALRRGEISRAKFGELAEAAGRDAGEAELLAGLAAAEEA